MSLLNHLSRLPVLHRLIPSVRKRLNRRTATGGYSVQQRCGLVLLLNIGNYVDRQLMFDGAFEEDQRAYFFDRMQHLAAEEFWDIGGNIGLYSLLAAGLPQPPRIIAFEPDRRNIAQFSVNLLMNRKLDQVTLVEKAVSDIAGPVGFAAAADKSTGESRVATGAEASSQVEAVRLDEFFSAQGRRIFIKMDIEGHELSALRGMVGLLSRNHIFLQVESFPERQDAVTALLTGLGLRQVHRIRHDLYFSNFPDV